MSTQSVIPFPCRKTRVLSPNKNILNCTSDEKKTGSPTKRSHQSISLGCPRSIMQLPKSPRKYLGDSTNMMSAWSNDDLLEEIFKYSPHSPVKSKDENSAVEVKDSSNHSQKGSFNKNPLVSPTRAVLSPIRSLSLNSPEKSDTNVDTKRSKILQLKLKRVEISKGQSSVKLPPDETPTKSVSTKANRSRRKLLGEETPQKSSSPLRRVTRSSKKEKMTKLGDVVPLDDFKENIPPGETPSPTKKQKPSPEKQPPSTRPNGVASTIKPKVVRALDVETCTKVESPKKSSAVLHDSAPRFSPRKILSPKKRVLDADTPVRRSPRKLFSAERSSSEEVATSPISPNKVSRFSPVKRVLQLHDPDAILYQKTKHAFHSSIPDELVGREKEMEDVTNFIRTGIEKRQAKSLYISGAPGTGKSACLTKILADKEITQESVVISINCMLMRNSTVIYSKIASELGAKSSNCKTIKSAVKYLETALTANGPTVILFLDEMDQLDSKNQEVLYTIFEWPALPESRLLLIGIANALDLTDRILPRLRSRENCQPCLLNFRPYSKDQIVSILEQRVKMSLADDKRVIEPMAIQFCARKVSAVAGDARKALDICRRAVEVVETDVKSQQVLISPSKLENSKMVRKVGLKEIAGVLSDVYESSIANRKASPNCSRNEDSFPLQQKLAICTLILLTRYIKCKEVTLGKLHDSYAKICKRRQVTAVGHSEFSSMLQLIETRGIITIKLSKQTRLNKVMLALQEKDVEFALQDRTLLSSVLQEGLPK